MFVLLFLGYMFFGLLWLYIVHNKIMFDNMIQPLFAIVFWPVHILIFIFDSIWG